jgi:MerR family copper efflux transcriptional regulator
MAELTIGQLAKRARVNVETVRYFERRGLVMQPVRPRSGYRRYGDETVERIRLVKRAQDLGFSLEEVGELLALRVDPQTTCTDVRSQAEAKIVAIEEKLRELDRMKRALEQLTASCIDQGPVSECPILEALEGE